MRAIVALSLSFIVGCGSAPFTAGENTPSDPTGAEMSPGMTPSPSSTASTADPPSTPDSGTKGPTLEAGVAESATVETGVPTTSDSGASTPDTGAQAPDSGAEVDAGGMLEASVVDGGNDAAVVCKNAYFGPNLGQGEGCAPGTVMCVLVCNGVPTGVPWCTSDCLTR